MPRVSIYLFLFIFLFFGLPFLASAGIEGETLYTNNTGQELSLDDNSFSIFIPPATLSQGSRISLAVWQDAANEPAGMIGKVYSWQVMDAEVKNAISVRMNKPNTKQAIYVLVREDSSSAWQSVDYKIVLNQIHFNTFKAFGQVAVTSYAKIPIFSQFLDATATFAGHQIKNTDSNFTLHVLPNVFTGEMTATVKNLPADIYPAPDGLKRISAIYYLNIDSPNDESIGQDLPIDIKYYSDDPNNKEIYYWDGSSKSWQVSPSNTRHSDQTVRTATHQKDVILAVFTGEIMEKGVASWYRWKNGNFAASPDYPKGTKLKVTNIDNDKSVIVFVNDYGPDRSIHPDRVIDLDRVAFVKIGDPSLGLVEVIVEKIFY